MDSQPLIPSVVRAVIAGGNGGYHTIKIDGKTVNVRLTSKGIEMSDFHKQENPTKFNRISFEDLFDAAIGQRMMF